MPELPEVRTTSKYLNKAIKNKKIIDVKVFLNKLIKEVDVNDFIEQIKNTHIEKISNYGKFILFNLNNNVIVLSHLRMEGKYRISRNENIKKNDHIVFKLNSGEYLFYNDSRQFGTFHIRNKNNYLKINPLQKLAKEPQNINIKKLYEKTQKKRIAIKTALLDQTLILGLGNIYVNEVLWEVKINPQTSCNKISYKSLCEIIKSSYEIMNKATKFGGTTIYSYLSLNQKEGGYQNFLNVHNKENQLCKRCQNKIIKIKINGRGTYYCKICQK